MTNVEVFKTYRSLKAPISTVLQAFMIRAKELGLNYVFINKNTLNSELVDEVKQAGCSVVIGQREEARIKISW